MFVIPMDIGSRLTLDQLRLSICALELVREMHGNRYANRMAGREKGVVVEPFR